MDVMKKIYKNWQVISLKNEWLEVLIAPQLGGRLLQFDMVGYPFFFNNDALAGVLPGDRGLGHDGSWLNFGGEKIWPAPQGWESSESWPGPPDPILDSGIYSVLESSVQEGKPKIVLFSPYDDKTGLIIEKQLSLAEDRPEVRITGIFHNRSSRSRRWSVWSVCQMQATAAVLENQYRIVCPINPHSVFEQGYKILHGLANNPQFNKDTAGNMVVSYQYLVGKIGLDTNDGWVAYLDFATGKIFILMSLSEPGVLYPDQNTVQIWTQGKGMIYSRKRIIEYADDPVKNPPYMEIEVLSPIQSIPPGGQIKFEYRMLSCTIPAKMEIKSVSEFAVLACPLCVTREIAGFLVTGAFGFFINGTLRLQIKAIFEDLLEEELLSKVYAVSPCTGVDVKWRSTESQWRRHVLINITANLYGEDGQFVCEIDKVERYRTD